MVNCVCGVQSLGSFLFLFPERILSQLSGGAHREGEKDEEEERTRRRSRLQYQAALRSTGYDVTICVG